MRKAILLAMGGVLFLAGCGSDTKEAPGIPVTPKWKGPAYRIAFDTQAKPNPTGVTIPAIKYTANPEALETRATLVVRFDASQLTKKETDGPAMNKMIIPFPGGIRLRAGAASAADAKQACDTLKAAGENCFVAQ